MARLAALFGVILHGFSLTRPSRNASDAVNSSPDFDWISVHPSTDFSTWHKCYNEYECARLEVPLDWNNISNSNKVVIAVARLPARVDSLDPSFGGTIVLNPGGPGGGGVDYLIWSGKEIQTHLDGDKHFELLSFDTRGTRYTTPSAACYDSTLSRQESEIKMNALGTIDLADLVFDNKWAASKSFAQACERSDIGRYPDGSKIQQFVSSSMVAHDILAIIDRLQENREEQLAYLARENGDTQQLPLHRDAPHPIPALLNFWGFSYGTYLGNTFASMFPSRVGTVILDGVVDAQDYAATGWRANLQDAPRSYAKFFEYCFDAGPKCPLYQERFSGPADIEEEVSIFLEDLKTNPIPVLNNGTSEIISHTDVRYQIFRALYFPNFAFPKLAQVLSELRDGNTTTMAPLLPRIKIEAVDRPLPPRVDVSVHLNGNYSWDKGFPDSYAHEHEAARAILCGDGDRITNRTKAEHKEYIALLLSESPISAGWWSEIPLTCIHWPESLRPADHNRFTGPFGSKLADYDSRGRPILFIGNTADPVTPLRNAYQMSKSHEGSVVLVQDTPGHCSGPITPNKCSYEVVKRFFSNGTLPEEGTICPIDMIPWRDYE